MDDSPVQTALCVIGHPIGGNPTQFVAAKTLAALGLDWQFISFDVEPTKVKAAISGIDALGFGGVMIAEPYQSEVARYLAEFSGDLKDEQMPESWYDSLFRNEQNELVLNNLLAEALRQVVELHEQEIASGPLECLIVGDLPKLKNIVKPFASALPFKRSITMGSKVVPWDIGSGIDTAIETANTKDAAHQDGKAADVESRDIQPIDRVSEDGDSHKGTRSDDGKSLVLDSASDRPPLLVLWAADSKLSKKNPGKSPASSPPFDFLVEKIAALHPQSLCIDLTGTARSWFSAARDEELQPIAIIDRIELDVRRLALAIHRWTSLQPNLDAMREAIEEYLEV